MHTIHEQPGRCRGCLVVAPADDSAGSTRLSPKTAALARASKPEGSCSWIGLLFSTILRFLKSGKHHAQPLRFRNYYTNHQGQIEDNK